MKNKAILILMIISLLAMICGCGTNTESKVKEPETSPKDESISYEYDKLQEIFISVDKDTTLEEFETIVTDSNLPYSTHEYNGGKYHIKVAFDEEVTPQKYAKDGDNVDACFNLADGSLENIEYNNVEVPYDEIHKAVLYVSGVYYDFREAEYMDGDYSGYYGYKDDYAEDNGIKIKYTNGNVGKTDYYAFKSAEDVINCIIDNLKNS